LDIDLWAVQNRYFQLAREVFPGADSPSARERQLSRQWVEEFGKLGRYLKVRVP